MSVQEASPEETPPSPPTTKREAASLITHIGRGLLTRSRKRKTLQRRIARWQKKATALQEEEKELTAACLEELEPFADDIADFSITKWDELKEKGTRTIRYATGEVRLRAVGKPTITIKNNDVVAFFREVRRKGLARTCIRILEEPNIDALHDDLSLAARLKTVEVAYTTKLEIRPTHSDDRLESTVAGEGWAWEIAASRAKKEA